MTKKQLIKNHDSYGFGFRPTSEFWLNEIERRDRTDHENTMMKYTSQIRWMTFTMTFATIIMTFATIANIVLFVFK